MSRLNTIRAALDKVARHYVNGVGLFLCLVLLLREYWRAERPRRTSRVPSRRRMTGEGNDL